MITTQSILTNGTPSVIQFENANEGRTYPFADNATLVSESGKTLPSGFITDLHLIVPNGFHAYLSSAYVSRGMVSACIRLISLDKELNPGFDFSLVRSVVESDSLGVTKDEFNRLLASLRAANFRPRGTDAVSVVIKASEFEPYRPYRLEPVSGSEDFGGAITFGQFELPDTPESYRFFCCAAKVDECALARYEPSGVRRFVDPRTGNSISGDVRIAFSAHVRSQREGNGVRLSLDDASRQELLSDCDRNRPANACGAIPIETINGISPDDEGRIAIWFH